MLSETSDPVERVQLIDESFTVYPNPGNGEYAVVLTNSGELVTNWNIIDELGRRVEGYQILSMDAGRYEIRFTNSMANGLYYISWLSQGEVNSVRWMVSR
jgi:hypothetical protein